MELEYVAKEIAILALQSLLILSTPDSITYECIIPVYKIRVKSSFQYFNEVFNKIVTTDVNCRTTHTSEENKFLYFLSNRTKI